MAFPLPLSIPFPDQPPPREVLEEARRAFVPPLLMASLGWCESRYTERHITLDDGGTGAASYGYLQIHEDTLADLEDPLLACLVPDDLLVGRINAVVGCRILRYYLRVILQEQGYTVLDYADLPLCLASLDPDQRRAVLTHAVACYTVGPQALAAWPDGLDEAIGAKKAAIKRQHVSNIMVIYEWLQKGNDND